VLSWGLSELLFTDALGKLLNKAARVALAIRILRELNTSDQIVTGPT
jgi:hypothetical protein